MTDLEALRERRTRVVFEEETANGSLRLVVRGEVDEEVIEALESFLAHKKGRLSALIAQQVEA